MLDPELVQLAMQYPQVVKFLMVMSVCRLIMKPVCSAYIKYVEDTPEKDDDRRLADIQANPKFKLILYILDLLFSVKLPKKGGVDESAS